MKPGPRFALVVYMARGWPRRPTVHLIPEDTLCHLSAGWIVLARDSEMASDSLPLNVQSNPRRVEDDAA